MPVRELQALDGANGLDVFDLSLKACRSGFKGRLRVRLAGTERERANREHPDREECPTHRPDSISRSAWSSIVGIV